MAKSSRVKGTAEKAKEDVARVQQEAYEVQKFGRVVRERPKVSTYEPVFAEPDAIPPKPKSLWQKAKEFVSG